LRAFALCPEDLSPKDPGDRFAARERELSGKDGFEKLVAEVAELDRQLDLYGLSRFTPKI